AGPWEATVEKRELMLRRKVLPIQEGNARRRLLECALLRRRLQPIADPARLALLKQHQRLAVGLDGAAGDVELQVEGQELEVALRHVADERDDDAALRILRGQVVGPHPPPPPAQPPPHHPFPPTTAPPPLHPLATT